MAFRNLIIFFIFTSISLQVEAQIFSLGKSDSSDKRFYLGGNLGLSFGTITNIYIAPELAYALTENLHAGIGVSYQFTRDIRYNPFIDYSVYGGKLFGRYFFLDDFFVQAEYERLVYDANYSNTNNKMQYDGIYGGVGYRQWMGESSFYYIALLFDLNDDQFIFGINPFFRAGFAIGL
ncbi:MAG: hypothetical protein JXR34_11180 [Bacteroidales bacterium]|nr:hypothetical protein [Bacteroidales bacterium]